MSSMLVLFCSCVMSYGASNMYAAVRNLPDWFPGTGFKETARQWSAVTEEFLNKPYAFTRSEVVSSFTSLA